jgi:hypothetical protein
MQQAAEKSKQARKAEELKKNAAARDDEMEHQVENSEEQTAIHDEDHNAQQKRKRNRHTPEQETNEDSPTDGLDLTA